MSQKRDLTQTESQKLLNAQEIFQTNAILEIAKLMSNSRKLFILPLLYLAP